MEQEKHLTQEESFQIIQNMILEAKNNVKAESFIFLLWGWLVFAASLGQFVLAKMDVMWNNAVWVLMPVGGIITAVYYMRKSKQDRTRTSVSESLKYTWIAFTAALLILLIFNRMDIRQVFPVIMLLYGIGLFLSGGALQFRPLIFGGIFCWICAIAGFQVQNVYLLLILAAAVLGGYIIPGYMLKANNKSKHV